MLIQQALENTANKFRNKTALKFRGKSYSYSELDLLTNQIARGLKKLGLQRDDRVIIYLNNCPEVIFSVYGVLKADAIFVVINPNTKIDKLQYIINDCSPKFLVTSKNVIGKEEIRLKLLNESPSLENIIFIEETSESYPSFLDFYELDDQRLDYKNINIDIAGLIYTSGSTGFPKGVTMAHLNIMTAVNSIIKYLRNTPDDIILDVLPLSFDYGLYQVFMCFTFGGTLVLHDNVVFIYEILKLIQDEKITGFPGVPTIFSLLLKLKKFEEYDLHHLRYITNTGAAFPVSQIQKLQELFPHVQIFSMYGLTECKRVAYLEPEEVAERPDSVGKAMPNLEVLWTRRGIN